jgi:long-subunit fatty acid transport protein
MLISKMKKLVLFIVVVVLCSCAISNAQTKTDIRTGFRLGAGADYVLPTGDFGNIFNHGYGASLQLQTPVRNNVNFTLSAGYLELKGKNALFEQGIVTQVDDIGLVPLKAGVKYYPVDYFYLGGDLGVTLGVKNFNETTVFYVPNFGVEFPVSGKSSLDLNVRYERGISNRPFDRSGEAGFFTTPKFVGLRLGYNFG